MSEIIQEVCIQKHFYTIRRKWKAASGKDLWEASLYFSFMPIITIKKTIKETGSVAMYADLQLKLFRAKLHIIVFSQI